MPNESRFPLYVVSKGRSQYMMTSRALTLMGVAHRIVVEPQEVDVYARAIEAGKLLTTVLPLDMSCKAKYELCDGLGLNKSTGPGPARNFVWEHSRRAGHAWHWVMDDNIRNFRRFNRNQKTKVTTGAIFRVMEDFVFRYQNIAMAGPNYFMFVSARCVKPPLTLNTRIYSCNLIRNDLRFRWRGRYNEDTILSLDLLKAGWATVQFNAFLQEKIVTQRMKGGCNGEFYSVEGKPSDDSPYTDTGTLAKSRMLAAVHPDVARLVWKYRRWHHEVDYRPFKNNALVPRPDAAIPPGTNNYGMKLVRKR